MMECLHKRERKKNSYKFRVEAEDLILCERCYYILLVKMLRCNASEIVMSAKLNR